MHRPGAVVLLAALGSGVAAAESGAVNLHLEPSLGVMLGPPQTTVAGYGVGEAVALKADVAVAGPLALEALASFHDFPSSKLSTPGRIVAAGAGVRVRLLDDAAGYQLHLGTTAGHRGNWFGNLWLDGGAQVAVTGSLARLALEVALGAELSVLDGYQVGPFVKYTQVVEPKVAGEVPGDARIVSVGLSASFGFPDTSVHVTDRDGDGVPDGEDACPDVAGPLAADPKQNGCPPDTDGDGIADAQDACPNVPGPASEDPRQNGCPRDSDGEGVADAQDACPTVPGVATKNPATNGCPLDSDGDGIPDDKDGCPKRPGPARDDPAQNGCPIDSDGDGIADDQDACPGEAGPRSADPKKNGCPDASVKAFVTRQRIVITERVYFDFNKHTVLPRSYPVLKAVAEVLKRVPAISRLRIDGHADDVGSDQANQKISERRAQAVMAFLVKAGVDPKRLDSQGYGKTRPLVPGDTEQAREVNRRVEFVIVDPAGFFPVEDAPP